MAAIVQGTSKFYNGDSTTLQLGSAVTAGNMLVCTIEAYDSAPELAGYLAVSDNLTGSWIQAGTKNTVSPISAALWYSYNRAGGTTIATINPYSGAGVYFNCGLYEVSGIDNTGNPLLTSGTNTATGTAVSGAALVVAQASFAFGVVMTNATSGVTTITPGSGWTTAHEFENADATMNSGVIYRDITAAGTYTPSWTLSTSRTYVTKDAAFKSASSGGTIGTVTVAEGSVTVTGAPVTLSYGETTNLTVASGQVTTSGDPVSLDYTAYTITLATPADYRTFQRSGTVGNIVITGSYTGSPTAIEASFNGGAYGTIVASPTAGTFVGTLTNQPQGQGTLTVRFANDTSITDTSSYVGIGDVFIIAGQSNNSGPAEALQSYSHATLKAANFANDYNWKELSDPFDSATNQVDTVSSDAGAYGSWVPPFATLFLAGQGIPVAFVPSALSGTDTENWLPDTNHQDRSTLYGSMVYRALQTGCKAVLMWQGENSVIDGLSQATMNGYIDTISNAIMDDLGVKSVWCKLEDLSEWFGGYDETTINAAIAEAWSDNDNVLEGPDFSTYSWGGAHYPASYTDEVAQEWYNALLALFYNLEVAGGTVTVTGAAVPLTYGEPTTNLTVAEGSVTVTGAAAALGVEMPLTVAGGTVTVTGDAVSLTYGETTSLTVAGGAVTVTGDAVILGVEHPLTVAAGVVTVTGDAVSLTYSSIGTTGLSAAGGEVTVTGDAVTLSIVQPLTVASGEVTVSGDAVWLTFTGPTWDITVAEGTIATSGDAVSLGVEHPLTVAGGAVTVTGSAVTVTLAALILHGARRMYQTGTRKTYAVTTRKTEVVDD